MTDLRRGKWATTQSFASLLRRIDGVVVGHAAEMQYMGLYADAREAPTDASEAGGGFAADSLTADTDDDLNILVFTENIPTFMYLVDDAVQRYLAGLTQPDGSAGENAFTVVSMSVPPLTRVHTILNGPTIGFRAEGDAGVSKSIVTGVTEFLVERVKSDSQERVWEIPRITVVHLSGGGFAATLPRVWDAMTLSLGVGWTGERWVGRDLDLTRRRIAYVVNAGNSTEELNERIAAYEAMGVVVIRYKLAPL